MNRQPFLIGRPRVKPEVLILNLTKFFETVSSVKAAYIAQIFNPASGDPPHLSIGLVIEEDLTNIAAELDEVIKVSIGKDDFVDVIDISQSGMREAFSSLAPFYILKE